MHPFWNILHTVCIQRKIFVYAIRLGYHVPVIDGNNVLGIWNGIWLKTHQFHPHPLVFFFYDADMFDILLCRKWSGGESGNLRDIILHYLRVVGVWQPHQKHWGVWYSLWAQVVFYPKVLVLPLPCERNGWSTLPNQESEREIAFSASNLLSSHLLPKLSHFHTCWCRR